MHIFYIVGASAFVLGLGAVAVYMLVRKQPVVELWGRIAGSSFFVALMILPLFGLIVLLFRFWWRVTLFDNGLFVQTARTSKVILWDDIKHIYEVRHLMGEAETDHAMRIVTENGRKVKLDCTFREIDDLVLTIRNHSFPVLLAKRKKALQSLEPVSFDYLTVVHDGLNNGYEHIRWEQVMNISIEDKGQAHWLIIRKLDKKGNWFRCKVPNFPNLELFLTLVPDSIQPKIHGWFDDPSK